MDEEKSQEKRNTSSNKERDVVSLLHSEITLEEVKNGQASKSTRGMPWHREPKKDVISCEKLRGIANRY